MGNCTSRSRDVYDPLAPGDAPQLTGREADKAIKRMKVELDEVHPQLVEMQIAMKPYLLERKGVTLMMTEQRDKLHKLLSRKEELMLQRAPLMEECWEADADVIYEAFNDHFRVDKGALIDVLANRARWQINLISEVFEKKYDRPLKEQILSQMTTMFGALVTGSQTNLCKLLIYRILEQPERDAALMRDYINDQDVLCELFASRTNQELRHAMDLYNSENVKTFQETVLSKGYANYKKFMEQVLELNRDETLDSFPKVEASALAEELYKAGAGRTLSVDPEPFIRVFARINPYQFESINEAYRNKRLKDDIKRCFGGDFGNALLSRCMTKYAFLAFRLETAFKGMSTDKNTVSRILGCISRKEGVLVREAYDNGQNGRTLETALKTVLKKGNFLKACLSVIAGEKSLVADMSVFPLGSDREEQEDADEIGRDGERALQNAARQYSADKAKQLGHPITDEFVVPPWDTSTKMMTTGYDAVSLYYTDMMKARIAIATYRESVTDDIAAKKDIYYAMVKHCYETEAWIRVLNGHVKSLTAFAQNRGKSSGSSNTTGNRSKKKEVDTRRETDQDDDE